MDRVDQLDRWTKVVRGATAAGFVIVSFYAAYQWFAHERSIPLWGVFLSAGLGLHLLVQLFLAHDNRALTVWQAMMLAASMVIAGNHFSEKVLALTGWLFVAVALVLTVNFNSQRGD
jgi:hypothetical protein